MKTYTILAFSNSSLAESVIGPFTSRAEAERAMTRIAEQGYNRAGQRQAFRAVTISEAEEETEGIE